jgi:hypothetical protein
MKLLFENWRKHLKEQEDEELRKKVLNEISESDYEYIKDWMRNAPEEAYSFDNLFKGKKRIAITPPPSPAKGPIGNIVRLFEDNGYKINFDDSTVEKDVTTTIPKGPRAGERVTKKQKIRIGKGFQSLPHTTKRSKHNFQGLKSFGTRSPNSIVRILKQLLLNKILTSLFFQDIQLML